MAALNKKETKSTPNLEKGPQVIIWLLTAKCNMSCLHCYSARFWNRQELESAEAVNLVKSAAQAGVKHIGFSGGEVFLRPDAMDLIALASKLGMTVNVVTNGSMLNDDIVSKLARYEIFTIVSVDGATKETHEKVRGKGSWDLAISGLEKMRQAGVHFSLVMAISKLNHNQIPQYLVWARDLGATVACFIPVMPAGRASKELILQPQEMLRVLETVERTAEAIKFPAYLWCTPFASLVTKSSYVFADSCRTDAQEMDIAPDGRVLLCDILDITLSDVRGKGILEAWKEQKRHPLVHALTNPKLVDPCSSCQQGEKCGGGCFARAAILNGDIHSPDPLCPRVAGIL